MAVSASIAWSEPFIQALLRKNIHPNLDCPSALVDHVMGFDSALFTPIFVMARVTGWTAHIMEQLSHNALIRPLSSYNGPAERSVPDAMNQR